MGLRIFSFISVSLIIFAASFASASLPVELQWVFCEKNLPDLSRALNLPPAIKTVEENIYYLETPKDEFAQQNVFVKFRYKKGRVKSSVKVRFHAQNDIPADYLFSPDIDCEKDVYLNDFRYSCAMKGESRDFSLSTDQRAFLKENKIAKSELQAAYLLGPLFGVESELAGGIQIENLQTPDRQYIAEFSVRTEPNDEEATQKNWSQRIHAAQLPLCPDQAGKRAVVLKDLWRSGSYEPYSP